MKKQRLIFVFATLILSVAILFSCQKDEFSNDAKLMLKSVSAGHYFTYSENPLCLGEEATVTFDNLLNNECGNSQIQMKGPSDTIWIQVVNSTPAAGIITYIFTPAEEGEYQFRGKWTSTGSPDACPGDNIPWTEAYPVLTVENCGCETTLEGTVECEGYSRTVTYTFIPEADGYVVIQGGFTRFATNFATVECSGLTESENENSNAGVRSFSGMVEECQEYTITVTWDYQQWNKKGDQLMEDGHVIDTWSAKLFDTDDPETQILIKELVIDPMWCGDSKEGYEPVEDLLGVVM
jgi:hypothetical protein